tara:strand:+ start:245 stop:397 length:153 start_codon:yes stop_codon:yes gene_type:complete
MGYQETAVEAALLYGAMMSKYSGKFEQNAGGQLTEAKRKKLRAKRKKRKK